MMQRVASDIAPAPWHLAECERLQRDIAGGRLHHALLLAGPSGVGKRLLAGWLLRSLLCDARTVTGPCGVCRGCVLMAAGSHPDSLLISPEEPGKQIRIAQVREELIDFVVRTSSVAARKVVLIEPAEAMNVATANCLLKSLEEPSADTHIILVSDAPSRLLATVRSRCRLVPLRPPCRAEGLAWLIGQRGESGAEDLLGVAAGRPLEALRLDELDALRQFDRAAVVLQQAVRPDAWVSGLVDSVGDMDPRELIVWMQVYLADFCRWMVDPARSHLPRAYTFHESLRPHTSLRAVTGFLRETASAARDAASTANPNRQLMLESLLHAWSRANAAG